MERGDLESDGDHLIHSQITWVQVEGIEEGHDHGEVFKFFGKRFMNLL